MKWSFAWQKALAKWFGIASITFCSFFSLAANLRLSRATDNGEHLQFERNETQTEMYYSKLENDWGAANELHENTYRTCMQWNTFSHRRWWICQIGNLSRRRDGYTHSILKSLHFWTPNVWRWNSAKRYWPHKCVVVVSQCCRWWIMKNMEINLNQSQKCGNSITHNCLRPVNLKMPSTK